MPDPDLEVIARLIAQDPGLSGALMKIVNSPHYGLSNKIASIQRAVTLLGSRTVINLINAQSIKGEMCDETIVTLNRFWDTAQDVAMTSYKTLKDDLVNAGANWVDKEVVKDGHLISSRQPDDIPAFSRELIDALSA